MAHDHHHAHRTANRRRLGIALGLAAAYMLAEAVGGWLTNSLALLADAGHMLSDVAALGLSLAAIAIAERPPSPRRTWGYYRAEILAALLNGATLIALSLFIVVEACRRLSAPPEVQGPGMLAIAAGGLAVNVAGMVILHSGRHESLNVRGAWLHMLTDALGSVGAIAAAVLIWAFRWKLVDPLISLAIAALVVYSAWALVRESVAVLMESAPHGIDVDRVRDALRSVPGVLAVHDLHVWSITTGMNALSSHVVAGEGRSPSELLADVRRTVHDRFGIDHITIQIEPEGFEEGV